MYAFFFPSGRISVFTFCVRWMYAFFFPSGRISVFTFCAVTSYIDAIASLMWRLLARVSTMNTSVFSSSIFFIADSVVSGYFAIALRGYIGFRACFSVFGRKKCTFLRTFDCFFAMDFLTILVVAFAFATLVAFSAGFGAGLAFGFASALAAAGAGCALGCAFFGAMATEGR